MGEGFSISEQQFLDLQRSNAAVALNVAGLLEISKNNSSSITKLFDLHREKERAECKVGLRNCSDISDIELRTRLLEKVSHEPQAKGKRIAIDLGKTGIGGMIGAALLKLLTS